jgi:hypothetical protein
MGNARVAAGKNLVGLDGMMNAGLCADFDSVSNLNVADYSDLSGQDHLVSKSGAARNTHLPNQKTILTHYDIVRDHDEIIDFCAAFYPCPAKSCPIDRSIGAYLHVIVDLHYAGLGDFHMPALFVLCVPVSIRADYSARVDNNPVAEDAPVEDGDPGVYQTPLAHSHPFAQVSASTYPGPGTYLRIVSNMRKRACRNSLAEQHTLADKSGRMYSGLLYRIGQKQLGRFSQSQVGIPGDEKIEFQFLKFRRHNQSRCPASWDQMTMAGINQKAQLPGGCALQRPYAGDMQIRVPLDLSIQQAAKFAKRKGFPAL